MLEKQQTCMRLVISLKEVLMLFQSTSAIPGCGIMSGSVEGRMGDFVILTPTQVQ